MVFFFNNCSTVSNVPVSDGEGDAFLDPDVADAREDAMREASHKVNHGRVVLVRKLEIPMNSTIAKKKKKRIRNDDFRKVFEDASKSMGPVDSTSQFVLSLANSY